MKRKPEDSLTEPSKVHAAYADCNGNVDEYRCRALTEKFCVTRGKCKFYKAKEMPRAGE